MSHQYQKIISSYYLGRNIHPESFNCPNQNFCKGFAHQGNLTEAKMSMVGSLYGEKYPKIVVVSLDPPSVKKNGNQYLSWEFVTPSQRTTEYVTDTHENDRYDIYSPRPNPHWAMTQIIVKDLLQIWGFPASQDAATVAQSYSGTNIENVSAYFAHVNVAKCSMNNEGQRQASECVHILCSSAYLLEELNLLEPEILISQGATTNKILGKMLVGREILTSDLPLIERIALGNHQTLWLPMHHPTQQLDKIRNNWSVYLQAVKQLV